MSNNGVRVLRKKKKYSYLSGEEIIICIEKIPGNMEPINRMIFLTSGRLQVEPAVFKDLVYEEF